MSSFREKCRGACHSGTFLVLWVFIAAISGYDAYRCVTDQAFLGEQELNPVAWYLIHVNGGDISLLIGLKLFGTCLALGLLQYLHHRKLVGTAVITFVVALCQLLVLYSYCPLFLP